MAIKITEKIIDIITTKFDDKDKFIKEQIQVIDDIKNFNLETFSRYILLYNKKLFIFDLKILGREWIKSTKFMPKNIINEDKFKDNILFLTYYKKTNNMKITVLARGGIISLNTVYPIFRTYNKCMSCSRTCKHVKINNRSGSVMCINCFRKKEEKL